MLLIIEEDGFNNTLAPYDTCNNSNNALGNIAGNSVANWQNIYLKDALTRISADVVGLNLTISDLAAMQQLCSYEVGTYVDITFEVSSSNSSTFW